MKRPLPQAVINGEKITKEDRTVIDKVIDTLITAVENNDLDWDSHDLSIKVIPKIKSDITFEGI